MTVRKTGSFAGPIDTQINEIIRSIRELEERVMRIKSNYADELANDITDIDRRVATAETEITQKQDILSGDVAEHYHSSDRKWSNVTDKPSISDITGNLQTDRLVEPGYVTGSITKTARPLFDVLRADRTAFLPESQIIIEKSTDAGATWQDAGVSDTAKRRLFTGQRPFISIPLKNGVKSTDCMLRITITAMRYDVPSGTAETNKYNYWNSSYVQTTERYCSVHEGWAWVNSNSDRIYMKVERATGANSNSWVTDREAYMSGWSGGNYFSLSGNTFGGGTTQTSNTWNWRFTFRTCSTKLTFNDADLATTYTTYAQGIYHLKICGRNVYNYSNNYMYHDHLYKWDENQNAIFPAEITANSFRGNADTATNADTIDNKHYIDILKAVYPIGTLYFNGDSHENPATIIGIGTWIPYGGGRVPVGFDNTQTEFNELGKTGGSKTHKLTIPEMPSHRHAFSQHQSYDNNTAQSPGSWEPRSVTTWETDPTGGDQPHNNLQPYVVVRVWKRIA